MAAVKFSNLHCLSNDSVYMAGVSSQEDCAIKIRNLESKLDSVVCTVKDRRELEKHVPMPLEVIVLYDKAAILWSLHEQIKQMEVEVEAAAHSSSRRSKWQFMGARDAGSKEELRLVYGVSERTESDGAANLIQKLRAINYALGELGQWCAYMVTCGCTTVHFKLIYSTLVVKIITIDINTFFFRLRFHF